MPSGRRDDEFRPSPSPGRAATVLPIVRAAMARGEGPPAVLAWVRRQGETAPRAPAWTEADERRARVLAGRLAASLAGCARAGAETGRAWATTGSPA